MIGDDVVVTVLEVRGDVVRLGIEAPRSLKVHREEVYQAVKEANAAAAAAVTAESEAALAQSMATPSQPPPAPGIPHPKPRPLA